MDMPYKWYVVSNEFGSYLLQSSPGGVLYSGGYMICRGRGYLITGKFTQKDFADGFVINKDFTGPYDFTISRIVEAVEVTVRENSGDSTTTA